MRCETCIEKSEEIRNILRPWGLHNLNPVGGVKILADSFTKANKEIISLKTRAPWYGVGILVAIAYLIGIATGYRLLR